MSDEDLDKEIESLQKEIYQDVASEPWYMNWRAAMAWMYFVVCMADFLLFPIGWAILHGLIAKTAVQWVPITLQGAGLFHLSMGAILGVAAWTKSQERVLGVPETPIPPPKRDEYIESKRRKLEELRERKKQND